MENTGLVTQEDLLMALAAFSDPHVDAEDVSRQVTSLQFAAEGCEPFLAYLGSLAKKYEACRRGGNSVEESLSGVLNCGMLMGIRFVLNRPEGFGLRHESRGTASGVKFSRLSKGGARGVGTPDGRRAGKGLAK